MGAKSDDWRDVARSLPAGRKARVACCRADASAIVSNGPRGLSLWCFRCDRSEFEPHGVRSIAEVLQARRADAELRRGPVALPADAVPVTEGPAAAHVWLARGGLRPDRAAHLGFVWSERHSRVFIPVHDRKGVVVGLQGRSLDPDRQPPKYLNIGGEDAVYLAGRGERVHAGDVGPVVLTEDVLSAINVSKVARSACLLGTKASPAKLNALLAEGNDFITWLDPDPPGQRGARKVGKALRLLGATVRNVVSEKDPKEYSRRQIEEILWP